jgi:hypothetical protein
MKRRMLTAGLIAAIVVLAAAATPHAQRGANFRSQSYSGNVAYDGRFVYVRLSYPWWGGRLAPWAHDWPRGEEHFLKIWGEITCAPSHITESSIMSIGDPELFKFPVAYMAEPGRWSLSSDNEAKALRDYLEKGGFVIFDDFRNQDWANFEYQMTKVLPEGRWVDLDKDSPIFHSFFEISSLDIIPQAYDAGRPMFRGYYQNNDPTKRLMVVAAFNTDMSEFWEWSDQGYAPMDVTNEAYKIGINLFMYGITH